MDRPGWREEEMKLLTAEIIKKLPKLYSQEKVTNPKIIVKYFHPLSSWTWYVIEGEEQEDGDWRFFGLVDGQERELGYFNLNQLKEVKIRGLGIERDMYFGDNHLLSEFHNTYIRVEIRPHDWEQLTWIANNQKVTGNPTGIVKEEIRRAIKDYIMENTP